MARPKGVKNKKKIPVLNVSPIKKIKLVAIRDVDKYEARRAYWYMLAVEKKIQLDPTSVSPASYMAAVKNYTDRMRKYEPTKRMVAENDDGGDTEIVGSSGAGKDGSADLGAGTPTVNPIT